MSDDEEGDYNTITHTETGRGVKLLFSKSKVYIHPTPSARDNIPGYIALLQQKHPRASLLSPNNTTSPSDNRPTSSSSTTTTHPASSDLLLAWLPESQLGDAASIYVKVDLCDTDSPPKQSYLVPPPPTVTTHPGTAVGHYAFAVPVSAVYSLLVRPPSVGWWYGSVIINCRAGDSFPPLFFHDNECQSTILQKRRRARDRFDPFGEGGEMFWGGDEVLRWLKRYVAVERSVVEPNVYLLEPSEEDSLAFGGKGTNVRTVVSGGGRGVGVPGPSRAGGGAAADGGMDPFMKFVKETGWNIMEKFSKVTTFTRQAAQDVLDNPRMPPQVRRLLRNPEVQTLQDEFDSARIYLARWAMGIAEQSERDRNQRIWTAREVMELEDTDVGEFELLDSTSSLTLEQIRKPVTLKEWRSFFDARTGRLSVTVDEVKERVFHGGLDPEDGVRKEAWMFLLGVYEWYSTADERKAQAASLRDAYIKLKGAWWERQIDRGGEGEEGEWWREQRGRIGKFLCLNHVDVLVLTPRRERRPPHRPQRAHLRRRGHPAPGPRLALRRGRHQRAHGADEGHAADLQRIQPRPGLRARHVGPPRSHLRGAAGRRHGLLGLQVLHGPHGAQLPARPVGHARAAARPRPSRAVHGPQAVRAPRVGRQHQLLLLLPHAAGVVQARVQLARRAAPVGGALDRLPEQRVPPVCCAGDP